MQPSSAEPRGERLKGGHQLGHMSDTKEVQAHTHARPQIAFRLSAQRSRSKDEAGRGRGMTTAFIDVGAGHPIAGVAGVAGAGVGVGRGRGVVGARGVGLHTTGVDGQTHEVDGQTHAALACTQRAHQEPPLVSSAAVTRWCKRCQRRGFGIQGQRVSAMQRLPTFHVYC